MADNKLFVILIIIVIIMFSYLHLIMYAFTSNIIVLISFVWFKFVLESQNY